MDLLLTSLRAPLCLPVGWDVPPLTGFLPGTQASMAERRWPTSWTTLVTPIRFMWSPDSRGKRRQSQEDARQKRKKKLESFGMLLAASFWSFLCNGFSYRTFLVCTLLLFSFCSQVCWYFGDWLGWQPISPARNACSLFVCVCATLQKLGFFFNKKMELGGDPCWSKKRNSYPASIWQVTLCCNCWLLNNTTNFYYRN
jgi:hypothetical protein